ncbi:T9SS type A sorting domain-containing protein [Flavobacterium hercynium]|uniref:Secretion system C-terminal sorting domain-containing protein n=1 Tax=Flavobacterium hercynium TaxID=387094 RepID=A0A226GQT5_9FLAO|nr:T9SS type A sorting domain-containing protein [Flavobacterium hercynium]OXA84054.1 hypothetical protein B0A66_21435 [Flavobacterium hercynium]SMP37082.1 Por secretion system C-terminal sorting domain-containing protein [Flavobacterium hercynium]
MRTKLLLLLLLANFSISTYGQRNLLSNGDFETWSESKPEGWFIFYNNIFQSSIAQNGSFSAKMQILHPEDQLRGLEFPSVEINKTYRVTMYYKVASGSMRNLSIGLYNSGIELIRNNTVDFSSSEWKKIELEYTNTAAEYFQIIINASGVINSEILIDNISIVDINEDPLKTVSIPDINFEKKLISLGIDSGIPDGKVLNINVDRINHLDISESSITDLTGIEAFKGLRSLDISINNLTILDLSQNKKINSLIVNNNELTNLDLSQNRSIISLHVNNNKLKDLDLSSNIHLYSLIAYDNELTNVNLTKSIELKTLWIDNNKLTSLDITANTSLNQLNCGQNKLTDLDISNNIDLEYLDVYSNYLTSLNVTKNTSLKSIDCYKNQLTSLNTDNNIILESLDCSSNALSTIDVKNNPELVYLNIGVNNIKEVDVTQQTKLDIFYCFKNQIKSLNLSQNKLLTSFACQQNQLTSLDFSHNPELIWFDCSKNQITSLDISKNPKVNEIGCDDNKLTYLNLRNGNNTNFNVKRYYITFINNPDLTCILVDDAAYSTANWSEAKDAHASYSTTCTLGLETSVFDKVALYPNPTKGNVTITNLSLNKATVYNSTGQLVKSFTLDTANTSNTISLSGLPKGIYYVYLINQNAASAKKVIVE